jgi:hypothetical protein
MELAEGVVQSLKNDLPSESASRYAATCLLCALMRARRAAMALTELLT